MKIDKEKVEIALATNGMLLSNLCDTAGITRVSLNLALNGKRETRPQTIGKIAKALDLPVEAIIQKEEG